MLTEEYLRREYLEGEKSLPDISRETGIGFSTIQKALHKYEIPVRGFTEAAKTKRTRHKHEETNLERTGFRHNFCKQSPSRKKWEQRLLEEEGITNVFQREEVKKKSAETLIKKYGVERPWKTPNATVCRGGKTYSKLHREVVDILRGFGVEISIELKVVPQEKLSGIRQYYAFDIGVDGTNKLIEVYGDYWHGNPTIYTANDLIMKGCDNEFAVSSKWDVDKKKRQEAIKQGYKLFLIWEKEWKNNKVETIRRLLAFCNGTGDSNVDDNGKDQVYPEAREEKR